MTYLSGRRIVITGASRGIGFESCKRLLQAGAQVLGVAKNADRLEKSAIELSPLGSFEYLAIDVADSATPTKILEVVSKRWGSLDILINNAGVQTWNKNWVEEDAELLHNNLQINLLGPHRLAHALLPCLLTGLEPRIVNVSTGAAVRSEIDLREDMPAYRISKMALNALTQLQATALHGQVAVNSLDPGWLKTDLGGPTAPGEPADGGERMMELLDMPFDVSGRFFHGNEELQF